MQNIHPLFVHFPIALLSFGLFCAILGEVNKKDSLIQTGWWLQLFGTIAIIFTAITGLIAGSTVIHGDNAHDILETHEIFELLSSGIFILIFLWRSLLRSALPYSQILVGLFFLLYFLALGLMLYGAHLGGKLVYEFGVGGTAVKQPEHTHHHHNDNENDHQHHHDE